MARYTFSCIDGHTCGNPVRLVSGGAPLLTGNTMLERRAHFLAEFDWIRTGLMFEPRGHDMMSGSILFPPTREDCDIGILFIETSGCLYMCGHGTIGTVTMAIENGLIRPKTPGIVKLDTPAGVVTATYRQEGPFVEEVRITNVPSFLYARGLETEVEGLGRVSVDVAYGGNFYAIVDRQENFSDIAEYTAADLIRFSPQLQAGAQRHPPFRASGQSGDQPSQPCVVDGQADRGGRDGAQCGVLRRQSHRPLALRHRHLRAHGAMGGARQAAAGR